MQSGVKTFSAGGGAASLCCLLVLLVIYSHLLREGESVRTLCGSHCGPLGPVKMWCLVEMCFFLV